MNNLRKQIGANIKKIREKKGLSQEKLADLSGIHATYIGQIERGLRNTTIEALSKIATGLDVTLNSLIPNNPIEASKDNLAGKFENITAGLNSKQKDTILSVVKELAKKLKKNF